jgi:hypothetical protein
MQCIRRKCKPIFLRGTSSKMATCCPSSDQAYHDNLIPPRPDGMDIYCISKQVNKHPDNPWSVEAMHFFPMAVFRHDHMCPSKQKQKTKTKKNSNSSHREHLLSQMVLVITNRSVPSSNCLVFAHHNVLCDLVQQSSFSVLSVYKKFFNLKSLGGARSLLT